MLEQLSYYPYAFLVPFAIVEGPLVAAACGVGVALGFLNPFIVLPILLLGDLLPDLVYWLCGRWGTRMGWVRRVATRVRLLREHLPALEELWRTRLYTTMLTVKLAWGISAPFIVSAGMAKVPLRRFIMASLSVAVPYLGILFCLGYGTTLVYGALGFSRLEAQLFVSVMGACFFLALLYFVRRARRELDPKRARARSNVVLPG